MIEGIKNCIFSICIAAVFGSIVYYVLPKGNISKLYKIVFGIFFLCCILTPLFSSDYFSKDFEELFISEEILPNNSALSDIYSSTENDIEQKIEHSAAEILDFRGIFYSDIDVKINISDSGSINIERFEVTSEEVLGQEILSEMERKIGAVPSQSGAE